MIGEHDLGPRGPEVELIKDKILSVRHATGRLLAGVATSDFEIEALVNTMKNLQLINGEEEVYKHYVTSMVLLTVGKGLEFYPLDNPRKTGSEGSEAVYAAIGKFKGCIFLAQYMYPNKRSSWHSHSSSEHFVRYGDIFKFEDHGKEVSRLGKYKYVSGDERHMIYTLDEPAFNLILNEGTSLEHDIVRDEERPSIKELRELTIKAGLYPVVNPV